MLRRNIKVHAVAPNRRVAPRYETSRVETAQVDIGKNARVGIGATQKRFFFLQIQQRRWRVARQNAQHNSMNRRAAFTAEKRFFSAWNCAAIGAKTRQQRMQVSRASGTDGFQTRRSVVHAQSAQGVAHFSCALITRQRVDLQRFDDDAAQGIGNLWIVTAEIARRDFRFGRFAAQQFIHHGANREHVGGERHIGAR